jgi:hypothetical protein
MKSKVMDRPLFKGPAVSDDQVENVGIMQGFMDDEDDLMSMLGADEEMDEDDNNQTMERSPRSPEILMNNLRGDMRSMDARIEELADLVGYNAAQETPEEVLMLLQPILAQQGIGGLPPAGAPAMPPQGMPPEMGAAPTMPPEMGMPPAMEPAAPDAAGIEALMGGQAPPPMDQAPMQMAEGGYVQRFQAGSDEEGVTPMSYPPELVKYAQEQLIAQRGAGNLKQAVEDVMPTYREILGGGDRRTMQGQALMDIAQAGLNLASGTNAQGQRLKGSFASQLAGAASGLPEKLAARAGQFQQEERAIKLAALKSAESNVESQRKLFSQIVKSAGQSPFGKGDWDFAILNRPGLLQKWTDGKTTEEENNLIDSAITKMQSPRTEFKTDPVTKQVYQVQVPGVLPLFVATAVKARGKGGSTTSSTTPTTTTTTTTKSDQDVPLADRPSVTIPNDPLARDEEQAGKREEAGTPAAPNAVTASAYSKNDPTFFNMAGRGTGPISVTKPFFAKIPILGEFVDADKEIEATTFLKTGINRVTAALGETERFGSVEKAQILGQLDLLPSLIDRPEAYQRRVVGLDTLLIKAAKELEPTAYNKDLSPTTQADARAKLEQIRQVRSLIGAPPRVNSNEDFDKLPIGTPFVLPGGNIQVKMAERSKR